MQINLEYVISTRVSCLAILVAQVLKGMYVHVLVHEYRTLVVDVVSSELMTVTSDLNHP
jgi:hypothetical protein